MSSIFETYGAREVLGDLVLDRRGREVGRIVDIVMAGDGRVSYALVELAPEIESHKLIGIPWRSLLLAPQGRQAAVNVDREALRGCPALVARFLPQIETATDTESEEFGNVRPVHYRHRNDLDQSSRGFHGDECNALADRTGQRSVTGARTCVIG
jgi:PRC-barrel domain protein